MGVTNLWTLLDNTGDECKDFRDKKLAIDLSGWICESKKAAERIKKPHIRNLFFRLSSLLQHGAQVIVVADGTAPDLKSAVISQRLARADDGGSEPTNGKVERSRLNFLVKECKELLKSLGVPVVESSGEAEALCGLLNHCHVVDGCISDDSDILLYGATTVYRDFKVDKNRAPCAKKYTMEEIVRQKQLTRRHLVALALLVGCDYAQSGVPTVGKEKAIKLFSQLPPGIDVLQRFQDWKKDDPNLFPHIDFDLAKKRVSHCETCNHPGTVKKHQKHGCEFCEAETGCEENQSPCGCEWHHNLKLKEERGLEIDIREKALAVPNFPNIEIIKEFLEYEDQIPDQPVAWSQPNPVDFIMTEGHLNIEYKNKENVYFYKDFMKNNLGWEVEESWEKLQPLLARWQIYAVIRGGTDPLPLKPLNIIKTCSHCWIKCYQVTWQTLVACSHEFTTLEPLDIFQKAYPDLAAQYDQSVLEKLNAKKKAKAPKRKGVNPKKVGGVEKPMTQLTLDGLFRATKPTTSLLNTKLPGLAMSSEDKILEQDSTFRYQDTSSDTVVPTQSDMPSSLQEDQTRLLEQSGDYLETPGVSALSKSDVLSPNESINETDTSNYQSQIHSLLKQNIPEKCEYLTTTEYTAMLANSSDFSLNESKEYKLMQTLYKNADEHKNNRDQSPESTILPNCTVSTTTKEAPTEEVDDDIVVLEGKMAQVSITATPSSPNLSFLDVAYIDTSQDLFPSPVPSTVSAARESVQNHSLLTTTTTTSVLDISFDSPLPLRQRLQLANKESKK